MNLLLLLSLHGSIAFLLVWALNWVLGGRMSTRGRRWWWFLVPVCFLLSIPVTLSTPIRSVLPAPEVRAQELAARADVLAAQVVTEIPFSGDFAPGLWLAGTALFLAIALVQTRRALRRWSPERLSTDPVLLDLLEDCKREAGITAPIGLVVSDGIAAPALLGWVRPRILLPRGLVSSLSREQLRAVFFHELAHFRFGDVPLNWIFTLARAAHWFNPLAHLAFRAWVRFREEAADEAAIAWLRESSGTSYGETLLCALRQSQEASPVFGALAIGESVYHLKRRLVMIHHYQKKSARFVLAGSVAAVLIALCLVRPVRADEATDAKTVAVAAMQTWLKEIDEGSYDQSWKDASDEFQKAVTSENWTATSTRVRSPLGKCTGRALASALYQTEIPGMKGEFVIAQFNSSFENLAYAIETVTFAKAPDGSWKASGYYIKPKL